MSRKCNRKAIAILLALTTVFTVACGSGDSSDSSESGIAGLIGQGSRKEREPSIADDYDSFAEAHDAFTTTLVSNDNDDDPIPDPPEGLFDLVSYPSKVGDLAAYVSSDPGDGEKHPMIIWVVGGWGNGIDDFPWTYPEWDNDQTGSAFWQAGILTMYPSFRGGNGNPGYYEALYGEVDDIISAYEYAASLPYVDPERIYLGGHSTGGTRALLASEYTDRFRAVFCFGAVDEIKYHNNDWFTFDTDNNDEYVMRSPIYWLDSVKSPTFLMEGEDGNSDCLERMVKQSQNDNIHGYVMEDADHFSVLGPLTRVVAEKILEDTGAEVNISITQEELEAAMKQEAPIPVPVMTECYIEEWGLSFDCPYIWDVMINDEGDGLEIYSRYEEENAWDMIILYLTAYDSAGEDDLQGFSEEMQGQGYTVQDITIDGNPAVDGTSVVQSDDGTGIYRRYVSVLDSAGYVDFDFVVYEEYMEEADIIFQNIIDSIKFDK